MRANHAAGTEVGPGDAKTPARADKVKDLASPGTYQCVKIGLTLRIIET